jgi:hypothetical protein
MKKLLFVLLLLLVSSANALIVDIGMASGQTTVRANAKDAFTYEFIGGYPASAAISGDGDTDLDLYVYDENGNQVCSSITYGDDESCSWHPKWTGTFKVVVKNRGDIFNKYYIVIK